MKQVAITQRLIEHQAYSEVREALDIRWGKLFETLHFLPIVLPYESDFKSYFNNIPITGIVLTGGNSLYHCEASKLSKQRDRFEKALIAYGINKNIPILGVCRGMQIIADCFTATFKSIKGHIGTRHTLTIDTRSRYYDLLSALDEVNAYHDYGIEDLNEAFIISATSQDGTIKAIEHKYLHIFGQMWHSEREEPFKESELNIIKKVLA